MPVPTIASVSPATGPSMGGNMVEILGTDFRLPDPPPATGPTPPPSETVAVSFGGVPAERAFVVSATRLFVSAPRFSLVAADGQPILGTVDVDVVVTNLDNAEVPIPGETVTAADAYTYGRVDLSGENESDFTRLVRELLRRLKSEVIPNISLEIDTDYDENLSTPVPNHGQLPALSILGPEVAENRFYRTWEEREVINLTNPGELLLQKRSMTVDLAFDIIGYADREMEFLNLLALCTEWKKRNQKLALDRDGSDPGQGQVEYDFVFEQGGEFKAEKQSGGALDSNLKVFRGRVVIVGFEFEGLPDVVRDNAAGVAAEVDEDGVTLQPAEQTGDTLPGDLAQARRGPGESV